MICSVPGFCLFIKKGKAGIWKGHGLWKVLVVLNSHAGVWYTSGDFTLDTSSVLFLGIFLTIMCDAEKPHY